MNIYVIYKFNDYQLVQKTVEKIRVALGPNNSIFMFEPNRKPKLWRIRAKNKIKDSQMVILFDSLSGEKAKIGKHISWELKQAEKLNKRIVIFKADPGSINRSWYEYDYSEKNPRKSRHTTVSIDNAESFMKKECGWHIDENLLHKASVDALTDGEMQVLLEQYRIMIDTSEKLMERRQQTVNLYITLCTTLIALIGASFSLDGWNIRALIALASGFILWMLCRNWRLSLESYDLNNTGKFMVINLLEKYLPAEIFECEYRYNKLNGIRSFSNREKVLPKMFSMLGIALMAVSGAYLLYLLLSSFGLLQWLPLA